jgi:hypothetical protein
MQSGYCLISGASSQAASYVRRMLVRLAAAGGSTRNSCSWYARSGLDARPGSIQWLACGHFVDLQLLIYEAARRCGGGYYNVVKNNISICRAETCYQVVSVLRKTRTDGGTVIISDLLRHFYGENVKPEEAQELFYESLHALRELSRGGGVAVSAADTPEVHALFTELRRNAGRFIQL